MQHKKFISAVYIYTEGELKVNRIKIQMIRDLGGLSVNHIMVTAQDRRMIASYSRKAKRQEIDNHEPYLQQLYLSSLRIASHHRGCLHIMLLFVITMYLVAFPTLAPDPIHGFVPAKYITCPTHLRTLLDTSTAPCPKIYPATSFPGFENESGTGRDLGSGTT